MVKMENRHTNNEPLRSTRNEARNVGLARMRSAADPNLHSKYNVDWKTVLGEGAYIMAWYEHRNSR